MTKHSGKLDAHATQGAAQCRSDARATHASSNASGLSHDHKRVDFRRPADSNKAQTRASEARDISFHLLIDYFSTMPVAAACCTVACCTVRPGQIPY